MKNDKRVHLFLGKCVLHHQLSKTILVIDIFYSLYYYNIDSTCLGLIDTNHRLVQHLVKCKSVMVFELKTLYLSKGKYVSKFLFGTVNFLVIVNVFVKVFNLFGFQKNINVYVCVHSVQSTLCTLYTQDEEHPPLLETQDFNYSF